jgi:hypothetical protein
MNTYKIASIYNQIAVKSTHHFSPENNSYVDVVIVGQLTGDPDNVVFEIKWESDCEEYSSDISEAGLDKATVENDTLTVFDVECEPFGLWLNKMVTVPIVVDWVSVVDKI